MSKKRRERIETRPEPELETRPDIPAAQQVVLSVPEIEVVYQCPVCFVNPLYRGTGRDKSPAKSSVAYLKCKVCAHTWTAKKNTAQTFTARLK